MIKAKRWVTICALFAATFTAGSRLPAQQTATAVGSDTGGHANAVLFARNLIQRAMEASATPGMSVAVGIDGQLIWAEGFGFADLEHRTPVWEETLFRVGSVSKPLTAAAMGLLVEQGQLDLDAPVQQYVPGFPKKPWPISTRQAAGHTAGIRHYREDEFFSRRYYPTVTEGLAIFQEDDLLFEPGTDYSYSSYGWNLVSAAVEGAAGEDFLAYMQRAVFDRLGLNHTVADRNSSIVPHRTRFYVRSDDGRTENAPYVDNSYKWAGGGFLSTPSDLVRFGFAHLDTAFLRQTTIKELWTPQSIRSGDSTGYGIGWRVEVEDGNVIEASHGGGSVGGTTGFVIYPQQRAVVAITGNMSGAPTGGMLPHLILESFLDPATFSAPVKETALIGSYLCTVNTPGETLEWPLTILGGPDALWGRLDGQQILAILDGPEGTRIIAPGSRGQMLNLTVTAIDGDRLTGNFNSGRPGFSCIGR